MIQQLKLIPKSIMFFLISAFCSMDYDVCARWKRIEMKEDIKKDSFPQKWTVISDPSRAFPPSMKFWEWLDDKCPAKESLAQY